MLSSVLTRERIRYLIEYGGIYPAEEPATKNFIIGIAVGLAVLQLVDIFCTFL